MSTTLYDTSNIVDVKCVRYLAMQARTRKPRARKEDLARFVAERRGYLKKSYAQVANDSKGQLSHGTVFNIEKANGKDVSDSTLRGLADGLEVPFSTLVRIYYGDDYQTLEEFANTRFANLAQKFETLSDGDQHDMLVVIEMLEKEIDARSRVGRGIKTQRVNDIVVNQRNRSEQKRESK